MASSRLPYPGILLLASLAWGCEARCDHLDKTYTGADRPPTLDVSVREISALLSEQHELGASWIAPWLADSSSVPAPPFSGGERLTIWAELPEPRFRVDADYQVIDADCALAPPAAEATLHVESASGRLRESVHGKVSAREGRLLFSGSLPELTGSARSYLPPARFPEDRKILFEVDFATGSAPRALTVTLLLDGGAYRFLMDDGAVATAGLDPL